MRINLRNSLALKQTRKSRPRSRSRYRKARAKPSQFALAAENEIEVTQNFSMVKKKGDGLNYSVLGHSQFVDFREDAPAQPSRSDHEAPPRAANEAFFGSEQEPAPHFFARRGPADFLDKVLSLECPSSQPRLDASLTTPKRQEDLVEMVKSIFQSNKSDVPGPNERAAPNLFKAASKSLRKAPLASTQTPALSFLQPRLGDPLGRLKAPLGIAKPRFGAQVDCSDVLLHIRQRQLYRRPLQLFQRN